MLIKPALKVVYNKNNEGDREQIQPFLRVVPDSDEIYLAFMTCIFLYIKRFSFLLPT